MKAFRLAAVILLPAIAGCGPGLLPSGESDAEPTATTGGSTEAPPPPSPPPGTSTSTSTTGIPPSASTSDATAGGSESTEGLVFLVKPDGFPVDACMCDVFAQDCPAGEKCMPTEYEGNQAWDCTRCSEISDVPRGEGEPCTVEGSPFSGIDDCGAGLVCWDVDPGALEGTCVAMCTGDESSPHCEGSTDCLVVNGHVLALCLPTCDPLAVDACAAGHACIPSHSAFVCVPTTADGPAAACLYRLPYACDPGSTCLATQYVGAPCDEEETGCCATYCSISQPGSCANPEQSCLPLWPIPPPAGSEDVGICGVR